MIGLTLKRRALSLLVVPGFFLLASGTQAGVSATAIFELIDFEIKDDAGQVIDAIDDLNNLAWTGAADEDVFLNTETPQSVSEKEPNSTTGIDFPVICRGDCPPIEPPPNSFPVISGAPSANYSTADQVEVDAPITNLGSLGSPAHVGNAAYAGIVTGPPGLMVTASGNSNNSVTANFELSRDTALNFSGAARLYVEAFVEAGEIFPGKSSAASEFTISITNTDINEVVYEETSAPANQTVAFNANGFDFDVQLTGTHAKGVASIVDLALLPATPTLNASVNYQLSIRNNVNVDVARVEPDDETSLGCRLTGGGVTSSTLETGEIVYVWDETLMDWQEVMEGENRYQMGGQVGANTSGVIDGQPKGEWQHHQQRGPFGSFSFHAGTASAPAGTEIIEIRCSDPGGCFPSGNPPSPNKQLDFDCIGTFSNIGARSKAPAWLIPDANATAEGNGNRDFDGTFHYCEVNVDDLGEGPDPAEPNSADCPAEGFGEKGDPTLPANCDCPDFYRITIYDGVDAADVTIVDGQIAPASLELLKSKPVIYEVDSYLGRGGNGLQLHDLTGFDRKALP